MSNAITAVPLGIYWYTSRAGVTKQYAVVKYNRDIKGGRVLLFNWDSKNQVAFWPRNKMLEGRAGFWTSERRLANEIGEAVNVKDLADIVATWN